MTKTWLITGSSRGLGRALAEAVLAAGDSLVATARNTRGLEDLAGRYAAKVILRPLDVTDFAAARAAVNAAVERFGRLDVVANVAGYGNLGPIEDTSIEDFRAQIDTNLFGPIHLAKAAIPVLRTQGSGHILNFSSVGGRIGSTGRAPYSAAKFGVEGFSEVMVTELAPLGVKVTVFEPGGFRTDFAGSSQTILEIRPEYDATVGQAARFQRDYDGKQPGDPAKAAQVILKVVGMDDPPLRLLLGSDAARIVETADARKAEADRKWRDLSASTDFAAAS
ncbi:SDR family NAD(P)-dependent oxidoreductase [Phenylobacterium sp.]|jgi:NAD(P)-dependent dehydrogenase (short-subunit alcohol dehydrogenase family)|uniref:SDR family NAD(P)-dependent oxidoreductase n=1 Tax=Phenylobacterium sp. TaxID=1871053 RepID=UPI002F3FB8A8